MEINGVANILILLSKVEQDLGHDYGFEEGEKAIADIKVQLDLLERYMIAYGVWAETPIAMRPYSPPAWHEVKANPQHYKLNRER